MIVIIDFGSQTTPLIARRLTDLGQSVKILPAETDTDRLLQESDLAGLILSGGPASVYEADSPQLAIDVSKLTCPVLGICYGWQILAQKLGGQVAAGQKEYGPAQLTITATNSLLADIPDQKFEVWMSHGDSVQKLPAGWQILGNTDQLAAAITVDATQRLFGLQFHPEVEHTQFGQQILTNFVTKICQQPIKPKVLDVNQVIDQVKAELANDSGKVIAAISGGVDSTVAAVIVARAIGERFIPIYCDNGLMRTDNLADVKKIFIDQLHLNPIIVDCQAEFLAALKGVTEPEQKRQIIGKLYIEIFDREAQKIEPVTHLMQGTIYSDVIESQGTGKQASKIKSHHNVGGLPANLKLKLVEPLRYFFKDEVRELGRQLGLPAEVVNRQPFPGPGQAIRILGEVTAQRLAKQQQADQIVLEVLAKHDWLDKVFQSFPVMTGTNTTAVKGDHRVYAELVGLRIYSSQDVMTAGWTKLPFEVLQEISSRIVNEVPDVSRVVYDITTKPPATMEWE